MYDVIVVGTRAAGAAAAMLLARQGRRVLAVDRARFPSDTLSTHQIQPAGVARLERWGLLDGLLAAGTPATRTIRFDVAGTVVAGDLPGVLCSPRRTVLDALLVDAARAAGAEVLQGHHIAGLLRDGAGRVTGVHGRDGSRHHADLVVGADGKHSLVAKETGAAVQREVAALTVASYAYWEGVDLPPEGLLYQRPGRAAAAFRTNDGHVMLYAAAPVGEFGTWRTDPERHLLDTADRCGDLGARIRAGRRVERVRTTVDLPNVIRRSHGPGWALLGDARCVLDPVTAQGIGNAFQDAEHLAAGTPPADRSAIFDLTTGLARLRPPAGVERLLLTAVARRPRSTAQFIGVFAGTVPPQRLRSPGNVARVLLSGLVGGPSRTPRGVCRR